METALKLARAYHLARGEPERTVIVARHLSYHGNTRGALDALGAAPAAGPLRALAQPHRPRARGRRVPLPRPRAPGGVRRLARRRTGAHHRGDRPRAGGGLHRRAHRRGHHRGRRPHRRLLAGGGRGVPAPRSAAHRRRGHDRLRAHRALVRHRALGRRARHPGGGQGSLQRLLAARPLRGLRRGPRHRQGGGRVRARAHLLPPSRRGGGGPGGAGAHPGAGTGGGGGGQGAPPPRSPAAPPCGSSATVGDVRGRGLLAGVELVADRETRRALPARRAGRGTGGGRRPPPRPPGVLLEGMRRRDCRGRGGARATPHHHPRGDRPGRRAPRPRRWPRWPPGPIDARRVAP